MSRARNLTGMRILLAPALAVLLALPFVGCRAMARAGQAAGVVTPEQADAMIKTGDSFGKALEQITPEQEYYVGRAVGATLMSTHKGYDNAAATRYVNLVGQTLAMGSDKPETFGGYHFLIFDSDEINAFAAPGGLIFLSRGMLRLCKTEDELAAVLAHEVAHVNLGHAIAAISNSRWTQAFTILGTEGAKSFGGEQLSQLTTAFEGSIDDITSKLVTSGYARGQERAADALAVTILRRVGYDPGALARVLGNMAHDLKPGGVDFAKTHPPPQARIADLSKMKFAPPAPAPAARQQRFQQSMRGV
ncbi:MAG: M48 family metallopeptidase [Lentisphaerae bacterium]|nr:M48 family metallopeptidase [Lentisphaerota bacterium]